jgi:hypothetical protein
MQVLDKFSNLVRPERFERSTHSLEGCCSIQLSYGRITANKKVIK